MFKNCIAYIRKCPFYSIGKNYSLKYGLNPSNTNSGYYFKGPRVFDVLNGQISYINVLDAMLGWNLVNEVKGVLKKDVCASYKHNAPAGVSCLGESVRDIVKSSRNCDSLSSFGDFISVTGKVDSSTAKYLKTQVSDGIIAGEFTDEAMDILKKKKNGNYIILKGHNINNINAGEEFEYRDHFGVTLYQTKDNSMMPDVCSLNRSKQIDALLGWITLKYTPSNSVNLTYNNRVIGIGAGQQNRVACIRLAGEKCSVWENKYNYSKPILYTMCSDGFLPFKDNIDVAREYNVDLIVQPGGSMKDQLIKEEAEKYDISMIYTGQRTFYH
jgi:AICAR transformylase/IMP cyclohydrolase PurH